MTDKPECCCSLLQQMRLTEELEAKLSPLKAGPLRRRDLFPPEHRYPPTSSETFPHAVPEAPLSCSSTALPISSLQPLLCASDSLICLHVITARLNKSLKAGSRRERRLARSRRSAKSAPAGPAAPEDRGPRARFRRRGPQPALPQARPGIAARTRRRAWEEPARLGFPRRSHPEPRRGHGGAHGGPLPCRGAVRQRRPLFLQDLRGALGGPAPGRAAGGGPAAGRVAAVCSARLCARRQRGERQACDQLHLYRRHTLGQRPNRSERPGGGGGGSPGEVPLRSQLRGGGRRKAISIWIP
ncbi:uncharacterized protein [Manis javanica]|uniref:uncharacterized protein n=1 Tax=Manis javanica TaxID=9974 RepID=UPI003C6D7C28